MFWLIDVRRLLPPLSHTRELDGVTYPHVSGRPHFASSSRKGQPSYQPRVYGLYINFLSGSHGLWCVWPSLVARPGIDARVLKAESLISALAQVLRPRRAKLNQARYKRDDSQEYCGPDPDPCRHPCHPCEGCVFWCGWGEGGTTWPLHSRTVNKVSLRSHDLPHARSDEWSLSRVLAVISKWKQSHRVFLNASWGE